MLQEPTTMEQRNLVLHKIAAGCLIATMIVGGWQWGAAVSQTDTSSIPMGAQDVRKGLTFSSLEKQWDTRVPWRSTAVMLTSAVRFFLMHSGGKQVKKGIDGWLYLADELRHYDGADQNLSQRATWIRLIGEQFSKSGIALVVVLVPDKARTYPQYLGTEAGYPQHNALRYPTMLSKLAGAGLKVVDVHRTFSLDTSDSWLYYKTDTHWSQLGAARAASTVATQLRAVGIHGAEEAFSTTYEPAAVARTGDLVKLMGLHEASAWLRPQDDVEAPATTLANPAFGSTSLLGDMEVPVVLVGTSFSLRGNFHGYLQDATGVPVLNAAKDGSGFIQSLQQYLASEAFASSKPRAVVWEIPERFLTMPTHEDAATFGQLVKELEPQRK